MPETTENTLIIKRAQNALISHDFTTAVRLYKQLLKEDSSNTEYLKALGDVFVKAGEDEKAIPYYDQVIAFTPDDIGAITALAAIYRRLKRYDNSVTLLQTAIDNGFDNASVNYNLGFTYKEMGNFADAIDAFESVIAENPSDVLAFNHLGSIYMAQKDYQKSILSFKRGLQIDQNHPILNYNLAACYAEARLYPDAIRCYQTALKARPGWVDAVKDFSRLLVECQKTKDAADLVQHTIELHPNDTKLLNILGKIYLTQFDYDSAITTFKRVTSIDDKDVTALSGLGAALELNDKPQEALEIVETAMELEPENKDLVKQYIRTLLSAKEYDSAGEKLKSLPEEDSASDPQILDLYGQYYICRDDSEKADEYFNKIPSVNRKYKDHLLSAAARYSQVGKTEQAEKLAKDYIAQNTQNPSGYNTLASIYANAGNLQEALDTFNQGQRLVAPNILAEKRIKHLEAEVEELKRKIPETQAEPPETEPQSEPSIKEEEKDFDFSNVDIKAEPQEENEPELSGYSYYSVNEDDSVSPFEFAEDADEDFDFDKAAGEVLGEQKSFEEGLVENELPQTEEIEEDSTLTDEEFDFSIGGEIPDLQPDEDVTTVSDKSIQEQTEPAQAADTQQLEEKLKHAEKDSNLAVETAITAQRQLRDLMEKQEAMTLRLQQLEEAKATLEARISEPAPEPEEEPQEETSEQLPPEEEKTALPEADASSEETDVLEEPGGAAAPITEDFNFATVDEMLDDLAFISDAPRREEQEEEAVFVTTDGILADQAFTEPEEEQDLPQEQAPDTEPGAIPEADTQITLVPPLTEDAVTEPEEEPQSRTIQTLHIIERVLLNENTGAENEKRIGLFKKLLTMGDSLPEAERQEFLSGKTRMQLEFLVSRLSGRPGLLTTANSLRKSGVLTNLPEAAEDGLHTEETKESVRLVIATMKKLSEALEDQFLAKSLRKTADELLEKLGESDEG